MNNNFLKNRFVYPRVSVKLSSLFQIILLLLGYITKFYKHLCLNLYTNFVLCSDNSIVSAAMNID